MSKQGRVQYRRRRVLEEANDWNRAIFSSIGSKLDLFRYQAFKSNGELLSINITVETKNNRLNLRHKYRSALLLALGHSSKASKHIGLAIENENDQKAETKYIIYGSMKIIIESAFNIIAMLILKQNASTVPLQKCGRKYKNLLATARLPNEYGHDIICLYDLLTKRVLSLIRRYLCCPVVAETNDLRMDELDEAVGIPLPGAMDMHNTNMNEDGMEAVMDSNNDNSTNISQKSEYSQETDPKDYWAPRPPEYSEETDPKCAWAPRPPESEEDSDKQSEQTTPPPPTPPRTPPSDFFVYPSYAKKVPKYNHQNRRR